VTVTSSPLIVFVSVTGQSDVMVSYTQLSTPVVPPGRVVLDTSVLSRANRKAVLRCFNRCLCMSDICASRRVCHSNFLAADRFCFSDRAERCYGLIDFRLDCCCLRRSGDSRVISGGHL
jgi:hypothetical protein